jgi:2-methylisocitrate lyase-like PEP mutase family enzyme
MNAAQSFRDLHQDSVLLLPNAWDAGSARLFESLGAKAVATTSAGAAWARGYADGDVLPFEQLLALTRDIARVVRVPLSVDIEGGYSDDPAVVTQVVRGVIDAGAVGLNIEDGGEEPERLCAKIERARQVASASGVDLFVNARTDVVLRALARGDAAVEEVIRRAALYRAAGCDGLFVPGLVDAAGIAAVVRAIAPLPLNLMALPALPSLEILRELGVRRLSAGSAIAQNVLGGARRLASSFLCGDMAELFAGAIDYRTMNQLFSGEAPR